VVLEHPVDPVGTEEIDDVDAALWLGGEAVMWVCVAEERSGADDTVNGDGGGVEAPVRADCEWVERTSGAAAGAAERVIRLRLELEGLIEPLDGTARHRWTNLNLDVGGDCLTRDTEG
jgi:hypothetical protein